MGTKVKHSYGLAKDREACLWHYRVNTSLYKMAKEDNLALSLDNGQ